MPKVAVVGCGDVSAVHFEAISQLPDAQLVAICDVDNARLKAASDTRGVPGYLDYKELFDAHTIDVVHIATPHNQHADVTIEALKRGINVITEKPLASTLEQGKAIVEAAAASSARSGVCFQNRYNGPVVALKERLESGDYGRILGASGTVLWHRDAQYYNNRPWRGSWEGSGGGLLMNQAIHTLDLLQWLVGPVTEIQGNASNRSLADVIEVEDTAEIRLGHSNGAHSIFFATVANSSNEPITVSINTENAQFFLRGDLFITHSDGRQEVISAPKSQTGGRDYWGSSHKLLIADFYSHLEQPGSFWIDPAEAMKTLQIIKTVYSQSSLATKTNNSEN